MVKQKIVAILGWFGIALLIFGALLASLSVRAYIEAPEAAWSGKIIDYFMLAGAQLSLGFAASLVGVVFALTGGLIAKPRFLWIVLVSVGFVYSISYVIIATFSSFKTLAYQNMGWVDIIWIIIARTIRLVPGIASIIGGMIIRKLEIRNKKTN